MWLRPQWQQEGLLANKAVGTQCKAMQALPSTTKKKNKSERQQEEKLTKKKHKTAAKTILIGNKEDCWPIVNMTPCAWPLRAPPTTGLDRVQTRCDNIEHGVAQQKGKQKAYIS